MTVTGTKLSAITPSTVAMASADYVIGVTAAGLDRKFTQAQIGVGSFAIASVVNDGATDDAPAIQTAINSLPATGGTVYIVPAVGSVGPCVIGSTLTIGNGTSTTLSTKSGVVLCGPSAPAWGPGFFDSGAWPTFSLQWSGGANPMISINGPLEGWGLQDLRLDCNGLASHGIKVISGAAGYSRNLFPLNYTSTGIESTTQPITAFSGLIINSQNNYWEGINTISYVGTGLIGLFLDGDADTFSNTCFNTFVNCAFDTANGGNGIKLRRCDSNHFFNTRITANAGQVPINFDYTGDVNGSWPASNSFHSLDWGPSVDPTNTGSPGTNARPNSIIMLGRTNGARFSTLANLSWVNEMETLTFAALPTTGFEGMQRVISNSNTGTAGATVSGTGAFKVLAAYSGSNWRVVVDLT